MAGLGLVADGSLDARVFDEHHQHVVRTGGWPRVLHRLLRSLAINDAPAPLANHGALPHGPGARLDRSGPHVRPYLAPVYRRRVFLAASRRSASVCGSSLRLRARRPDVRKPPSAHVVEVRAFRWERRHGAKLSVVLAQPVDSTEDSRALSVVPEPRGESIRWNRRDQGGLHRATPANAAAVCRHGD